MKTPGDYVLHEVRAIRAAQMVLGESATPGLCENPAAAAAFWRQAVATATWFNPEQECGVVLHLNARRQIKSFKLAGIGNRDAILMDPVTVFREAVVASASAIVIMHNHPSGDPSPSQSDITVTRELTRCGQLLKIPVCDHVIMGATAPDRVQDYCSLRELGFFNL